MEMGICTLLRSSKGGRDNKKKNQICKKNTKIGYVSIIFK
jgi:hypothetical protein